MQLLGVQVASEAAAEEVLRDDLTLYWEVAEELVGKVHVPRNGDVRLSLAMRRDNLLGHLLRTDQLHQRLVLDLRVFAQARVHHVREDDGDSDLKAGGDE